MWYFQLLDSCCFVVAWKATIIFKKWRCGNEEAILKGLSHEMDLTFDDMYV